VTGRVVYHRRCVGVQHSWTSSSAGIPSCCVMCGKPLGGRDFCSWYAPHDPAANKYGRVFRHAQDTSGDVKVFRFDRKWGRRRPTAPFFSGAEGAAPQPKHRKGD